MDNFLELHIVGSGCDDVVKEPANCMQHEATLSHTCQSAALYQ